MSLFGIPIFISFAYYKAFIIENLPILTNITDDGLFIGFLLVNLIYIICIGLFLVLLCKFLIYVKNHFIC